MSIWTFDPLDSLFFRGAMPFNAGEGGYLDSMFPPTAQTLSGAFRYAVAMPLEGNRARLVQVVGSSGDDLSPSDLSFSGPYVFKNDSRLFPVPLHLLYSEKEDKWTRLAPPENEKDKRVRTDICSEEVLLAAPVISGIKGAKPLEDKWLDREAMNGVLSGDTPSSDVNILKRSDLYTEEGRVGIGRDNQLRTTVEGLLYFTRHLRLREGVSVGLGVDGLDDENEPVSGTTVRLGGEGRTARLMQASANAELLPEDPVSKSDEKGLVLTLLTHGDFGGAWFPNELTEKKAGEKAIWAGSLQGNSDNLVEVEIVTACLGKAVREGGWDYKAHAPKPLVSLVPAGSSYFVKVEGDMSAAIDALHGAKIGNRKKFGYGEIAVGLWK